MQSHNQLRCRTRFALHIIYAGQHLHHRRNACLYGFACAAGFLNSHGAKGVALFHFIGCFEARDLKAFAAEAHHHHAAHIWIGGIAPSRAFEGIKNDTAIINHTAIVLGEGHDSVDVGKVFQQIAPLNFFGDM